MTPQTTNPQLVLHRLLDAPIELVFKVWTDPEHLTAWWGPKGSSITVKQFNLQPGGIFHYCMQHPNAGQMWALFKYVEISPVTKLVFTSSFADADANIIIGPFFTTWPLEILNTLTLEAVDGKTKLTLTGGPINATAEEMEAYASMIPNMEQGFGGSFERLDDHLKTITA